MTDKEREGEGDRADSLLQCDVLATGLAEHTKSK